MNSFRVYFFSKYLKKLIKPNKLMPTLRVIVIVILILLIIQLVNAQSKTEEPSLSYRKIGQLKTKTTHEIEASNWSVGGETMDRDYTVYKNWSPYLEELGIKKVRLQGGWAKCETQKGIYNWDWLDEVILDLPKKGIKPWVCLCYGNPLYGKGEIKLGSKIDSDEETRTAWLKWVEAFVNRYKVVVVEWEIWNEPNGHNPPEVYAEMLIQTAEIIKSIQPESKIIGFALAGVPVAWAEQVLQILKKENKTHLVDFLSYHPYNWNPDDSYSVVKELYKTMKNYAPEMELLQGENGAPSEWRKTKALNQYEWTELTQAKWILRRMLGDLGRDIPSSVFSIVDLKYPDEMNRKGLLFANDDKTVRYKKQAYFAVQNLAAIFDNSLASIDEFDYTIETKQKESSFAYYSKKGNQNIVTVWLHTNRPTDYNSTTPVDAEFYGVSFKSPVWIDLRTGAVYEIPKENWNQLDDTFEITGLPVYDSPILIAEKELIKLK